ncbi:transporter substrate-binding domain-containing protein [Kushneria aurantia]|uniref:Transporter substrate-binding domain-containing protein n=1 Tax=Kushneria aurantia TaxID=504092 RepID=A0ABV6G0V4_9GAMM|nr:transporter substrate-binding domain-containing protein [Kushneria aurantia]
MWVRALVSMVLITFSLDAAARDLDAIMESGTLRVGTTGDYKPFSHEDNGRYQGFDITMAEKMAHAMGLELEFVKTTWPTLIKDLQDDDYDIGMSGISRTLARQLQARYSTPYLTYGKTPLVRAEEASRFTSLQDIDQPNVRIGVNPGGTNEAFVKANIHQAEVITFNNNLDIPPAVANHQVDVMITDSPEALFYAHDNEQLAAPMAANPLTQSQLAYLMQADAERLQDTVDFFLHQLSLTGELDAMRTRYGLTPP